MATVGDLFDELNGPSEIPDNTDNTTISELVKGDPAQVVEFDRKNENSIHSNTDILKTCLRASEDIVVAAYKLREFVPNLSDANNEQTKFWKESIVPNLMKVLTQDVKARSTLIHAFGAVRDLGIVIQKASEVVRDTRGSPKAIELAQKNIPAALVNLEAYIEKASDLDSSAINAFSSDTSLLFEIIGSEAADFVKRRAEIENELAQLYDRQNDIWDTHEESRANAASYSYLIAATQKRLENEEEASKATMLRIAELNRLNECTENKIQDISDLLTDSVTTNSRKFWFWRENKETVVYGKNPNEDREHDKTYYESLIIARMSRIREEQINENANKLNVRMLVELQAEYKSKYEMAKIKMENFNKTIPERMTNIKRQIDSAYEKLEKMKVEQEAVENKIGLNGNTLIECLVNVQTYSRRIKTGATAYSPLVSILNGIKAIVQTDIELLSGSNTDIFIAGNRLTKLVGFISDYSVSSRPMLELPNEYRQLSITPDSQ